jgi:hypothetical protein
VPGFSRVSIDYRGLGRYLRESPELRGALLAHAEVGVVFAKSIAPVGPVSDPHRGEFRDSISASSHTGPGGFIEARITAEPVWVEFGRKHREPYDGAHVLRRTGQFLNAPKRSV